MPVFEYKAFDAKGREVAGIVDADNARGARARLRKQGIYPTAIDVQQPGKATKGKGLAIQVDFSRVFQRVSRGDVATMTSQLATLVGASIPLVEALTALQEQVEKPALKVVLADVREKVNEGASLGKALRAHPRVFDDLYVNMVTAGEQSGSLDVVLERLTEHTEAMLRLRQKIVAALIYPVLMALVGLGLLIGIFTVVIPRVRRLFDSFGEGLPLVTRLLLWVSEVVGGWWWAVILLVGLAWWLFRRWSRTEEGRYKWHSMLLRVPILGRILRTIAVSRFCRTLSTLLVSGVPIINSLQIVQRVVANDVLAKAIGGSTDNIREGQSIAVPLRQSGEFPPLVTHMIAIGERTGDLEPMLEKVAKAYDAYVERALEAFTSLLEPILIIAMGGTIGFVALALLLPMLQMSRLAGS